MTVQFPLASVVAGAGRTKGQAEADWALSLSPVDNFARLSFGGVDATCTTSLCVVLARLFFFLSQTKKTSAPTNMLFSNDLPEI